MKTGICCYCEENSINQDDINLLYKCRNYSCGKSMKYEDVKYSMKHPAQTLQKRV
jgi:hypothetical protein